MNANEMQAGLTNMSISDNPYQNIDYTKIGRSDSGRAWVEKALHPPGEARSRICGMPDNEAYPSTTFEFRNTTTITPVTGTQNTWNLLLLSLPSPEQPGVYWAWNSGTAAPGADQSVIANKPSKITNVNYNFANWDADVSRWRRLYGSTTCELNAPSLSNQGMVYSAQQRLEVTSNPYAAPSDPTTATKYHQAFPAQQIVLTSLPSQPNQLQQMSPGFYKQMAKEGCFTVSGLAQPTNLYQQGNDIALTIGTDANMMTDLVANVTNLGGRTKTQDGIIRAVTSGLSLNWSSCWTLFTGISTDATVELKFIHGYECQAALGSSFGPFVSQSAEPDTLAVDAYYSLRHGMQDAYPAKYNFLGSLLSFLPMAISQVAEWLAPKAIEAAPKIISGAASAIGKWAGAKSEPPPTREDYSPKVSNMEDPPRQAQQQPSRIPRPVQRRVVVQQPQPQPRRARSRGRSRSRRARSAM